MHIDPILSPSTKFKFKWIKNLHMKPDTRSESGEKPQTHGHRGKDPEQKTNDLSSRSTINKRDLIKLKSFCKAKDTVNKTKWQPTDWEKIFTNPTFNRGLISNIYKELKKLDSRETNNPVKNGVQI